MSSLIGYANLVKSGTVTTTSDAAGYAKENAQSYKTSSWWKANAAGTVYFYIDMGSAVDVDCWGFNGSNLSVNSGTILPEYSATGAWTGEELPLDSLYTPTKDITVFKKVTSRNARYFRFEISSTGSASLFANLFLGEALELERGLPQGFSPANLNRDRNIFNNMSHGGAYLGRILRHKGAKLKLVQEKITRTWIDANFEDLADHVELYPFYFIWSNEDYPDEAAYCIANKITYPVYSDTLNLDFTFDCVALYDL